MKYKHYFTLAFGIILIIISIWQLAAAQRGLKIITLSANSLPVTIVMPTGDVSPERPTILIAHGLAGSSQLMRGFAFTLAHAGYTTVSWDFSGHGRNSNSFEFSTNSSLLTDAESALALAASTGFVNTQRVAILGHSMGSGVALDYGITHPDTLATIAISPVPRSVTSTLPQNLLIMAGSLEQQFVNNANTIISQAGGENQQVTNGAARKLVIIPNVEHISILFSPRAQATARAWLDTSFSVQPGASNYVDRRVIWFGLGIAGFLFLGATLLSLFGVPLSSIRSLRPLPIKLLALFGGGIASVLILWLLGLIGINLSRLFGIVVGGYMLLWFDIAGVIGLLVLRLKPTKPSLRELVIGLFAWIILWVGVGLVGNYVWLPWLLIPRRLLLWIPGFILLLPWFYLVANLIGIHWTNKVLWWVLESVSVILSLVIAINVSPGLGFLFLLLPLIPVMLAFQMLLISPRYGSWAYALSGAMFTAWIIVAVFPLS